MAIVRAFVRIYPNAVALTGSLLDIARIKVRPEGFLCRNFVSFDFLVDSV